MASPTADWYRSAVEVAASWTAKKAASGFKRSYSTHLATLIKLGKPSAREIKRPILNSLFGYFSFLFKHQIQLSTTHRTYIAVFFIFSSIELISQHLRNPILVLRGVSAPIVDG